MNICERIVLTCFLIGALSGAAVFAEAPASTTIEIKGSDQMKYDVVAFEVKSGQEVVVKLTNAGQLPKAAMAHNFVLIKPGTDALAFAAAGMSHVANEYIAPTEVDKVLAKTKLLGPGESDTITFTAPVPGKYDYLCTFPAHAQVGMRGVMTVN